MPSTTEILLIRHAPVQQAGFVTGRLDSPAQMPDAASLLQLAQFIGDPQHLLASPALRCRQTADALFPDRTYQTDARLWEQSFGAWEGMALSQMPDIGVRSSAELASFCPPAGESFADMCLRVEPVLHEHIGRATGRLVIVAHAGTVRAALAAALGGPALAMGFEVAPLSCTLLRASLDAAGQPVWSIGYVNHGGAA
ncbi:histidine phosphatase family protein [Aureimonas fodinaquatilis]|uniref:histidine phosphatase family protein n=1 Tax=Aureimonas fodinaquatilis TaxID=2565783 RepID=UPI001AEED096|nr:histidine phosphatase family protein [Aureimonas fodinaquatilis]